jgi:hypothetical protein
MITTLENKDALFSYVFSVFKEQKKSQMDLETDF